MQKAGNWLFCTKGSFRLKFPQHKCCDLHISYKRLKCIVREENDKKKLGLKSKKRSSDQDLNPGPLFPLQRQNKAKPCNCKDLWSLRVLEKTIDKPRCEPMGGARDLICYPNAAYARAFGPQSCTCTCVRAYVCVRAHVKELKAPSWEGFGAYIAAPLSERLATSIRKRQCSFF